MQTDAPPTMAGPPGFDARADAKQLLRTLRSGSLATLTPEGAPFASLVSVATLPDGRPILLLSTLSAHTRHLAADPRCALLLSRGGKGDPLAHPRLTVTGSAQRVTDPAARAIARARFLRRQPKAALYIDFADFGLFILAMEGGHLNGGFARAATLDGPALLTPTAQAEALLAAEAEALDHMNADHRAALRLYAEVLCKAGGGPWSASGLDPEGIDLVCGDRTARLCFDSPVTTPGALRQSLALLAGRARQLAETGSTALKAGPA